MYNNVWQLTYPGILSNIIEILFERCTKLLSVWILSVTTVGDF